MTVWERVVAAYERLLTKTEPPRITSASTSPVETPTAFYNHVERRAAMRDLLLMIEAGELKARGRMPPRSFGKREILELIHREIE